MKRKKTKLITLLGLFFLLSCTAGEHLKLKIDIPRRPSINLDEFEELIITPFLVKKNPDDFNINQELNSYFSAEFSQQLEKKVSSEDLSFDKEEVFEDKAFWETVSVENKKALFFTGSVDYKEEVRKSITSTEKRRFEDPFPEESRITQRKFYSLNLDVYLIDPQTGKILYQRTFKEKKSYRNKNQTPAFAFFDLIQTVKKKLFRQILGEARLQERYLIK